MRRGCAGRPRARKAREKTQGAAKGEREKFIHVKSPPLRKKISTAKGFLTGFYRDEDNARGRFEVVVLSHRNFCVWRDYSHSARLLNF